MRNKIKEFRYCPPDASFSMAGELHSLYLDDEGKYTMFSTGNGFAYEKPIKSELEFDKYVEQLKNA